MKQALVQHDEPFTLFGGEPLLVQVQDLEELFRFGYREFGHNRIQTNGTLIRAEHIDLFKRYNVHVGISVDGPGKLNNLRWAGSKKRTNTSTAETHSGIAKLLSSGIVPSLIITLHRENASGSRLYEMCEWLMEMDASGISDVRLHILEVDDSSLGEAYVLTDQENLQAFRYLMKFENKLATLRFDVFADMRRLLLADDDQTACVWNACDPYTTSAVTGVEGSGQSSNCGRTNKYGVDFVKADMPGCERYMALFNTSQEHGGCRDCRFFFACKGQCPGTAIDGDWRNRSDHCAVWFGLFEDIESNLIIEDKFPLSMEPIRSKIERELYASWEKGFSSPLSSILEALVSSDAE